MASNQANRLQGLDLSVEEFIDEQENENAKKEPKHDVALFLEILVLKGEMRQMEELTSLELNKFLSEFAKEKTTRNTSLIPQGHSSLVLNSL